MKEKVLRRVDLVSLLIEFYQRATGLSEMFDLLQKELVNTPEEQRLKKVETSWIEIQNHYNHVKSLGHKYLNNVGVSNWNQIIVNFQKIYIEPTFMICFAWCFAAYS